MGFLQILSWLAFGLVAGAAAKLILPGKDPGGCLVTIALGIAGAMVGGYLGRVLFGFVEAEGFGFRSFASAVVGAILLLLLYRIIFSRGGRGRWRG